ncbi:OPT/YSL family transporter [bacterium]|nr:OPT/YSL family transporter [bacterium]
MSEEAVSTPQTQVEKDQQWRDEVYQGDVPQFTGRALVTGLLLGWLMALSNLYVGLKSGWGLGVEITAIVLGFAIWKAIEGMRLTKKPLTMLENNIIMTSAVAPSYVTSGGLVSAIPAIWMLDPTFHIAWWQLGIWMMVILFLGLTVSIPIKRQMVNSGELAFPAVVPAAETLRSMYSKGAEAVQKASSLAVAAVIGVFTKVAVERAWVPPLLTFSKATIGGISFPKLTLFFETSWIFIGFGAFIGKRVGVTMLVGMLLNFGVLAPWMIHKGEIRHDPPQLRSEQLLEFPLTIPAGAEMTFTLTEAEDTPELSNTDGALSLVSRGWQDTVTYASMEELVAALNAGKDVTSGSEESLLLFSIAEIGNKVGMEKHRPIPFLPFELDRPVMDRVPQLRVDAPGMTHYEAMITQAGPGGELDAAAMLGFEPGSEDLKTVGGYRQIVAWTMWPGVGMMVVAGLLAFAFQWRTIGGAFKVFLQSLKRDKKAAAGSDDPIGDIEVPMGWFVIGFLFFGLLAIIVMNWLFAIPVWMGIIAVILSFFLAIVSVRASGETGISPIGAMGKVTQLTFGVLHPGSMKTNLMTANVTAGAAGAAGDMMNQFKVGHMVGAKPRLQLLAQVFGILMALAVVPVFFIMVPDASAIGTQELPAPAAIVWAGVAKLLSQGLGSLPPTAVKALFIAGLFGAAVTILEKVYPKSKQWWWLPSPAGMGIAMTVPALYSLSMFIGAMLALVLGKVAKKTNDMYTIPVASGFIAGESLTGVFFAILAALGG